MSSLAATNHVESPVLPDLRRRAGRVLRFLGVLEIVLFGMATFAVTRAASMSISDLQQMTGGNLSRDQLQSIHPQLRSFAMILALSGLVPGAIFLICSVAIERTKALPALLAILLAATQLFALGGILVRQLLNAIAAGDPPAMTLNVLAFGTPMAFLVFVIRCLFSINRPAAAIAP